MSNTDEAVQEIETAESTEETSEETGTEDPAGD